MTERLDRELRQAPGGPSSQRRRRELAVDLLPELYAYRDDGCEVSPSCLTCPLPRCKYDDPAWYQRYLLEQRDGQILRVREEERLTVPALARRFRVSQRTVFRAIQRGKAGGGPPREGQSGRKPTQGQVKRY